MLQSRTAIGNAVLVRRGVELEWVADGGGGTTRVLVGVSESARVFERVERT